ncbi:tyrosine-type recombinase/integrase [Actinomadura sp. NPDC049753]|uniref:tyrosine-type recombinase/integrase n=1 Tax=Actinomadura sp. NPDC049753 TaxID=3154739 RepID=UPI00343DC58E
MGRPARRASTQASAWRPSSSAISTSAGVRAVAVSNESPFTYNGSHEGRVCTTPLPPRSSPRPAPCPATTLLPTGAPGSRGGHAGVHGLRHIHATTLLLAGVPIHIIVAARFGHADPAITPRVYTHVVRSGDCTVFGVTPDQGVTPDDDN